MHDLIIKLRDIYIYDDVYVYTSYTIATSSWPPCIYAYALYVMVMVQIW